MSEGTPETTGFGRVGPKTLQKLNEIYGEQTTAKEILEPEVPVEEPKTQATTTPLITTKTPQLSETERQTKIQEITAQILQLQKQLLELQIRYIRERLGI